MASPVESHPSLEGQGTPHDLLASSAPFRQQQNSDSRQEPSASRPANQYIDTQAPGLNTQRNWAGEDAQSRDFTQQNVSPIQDREGSDKDQLAAPRDKSKSSGSRRPSGSRMCGKCGESLTGQFVRALGDTYHLECFTCHVWSLSNNSSFSLALSLLTLARTVTKLWPQNFSQSPTSLRISTLSAKQITFDVWTCSASNAGLLFGVHT